ncbi:MAG: excinuclease ABC subunit UvrA, partial [Myxococcota bacterium]
MTRAGPGAPDEIVVRGAREHNLQGIDVRIPRDRLVVVTGLSGSGKSSLAFDTLYAEGQRRYVESLSSYARQFLEQMAKPDVESIEGLSPAISIEQKSITRNPRSTVGTTTEIYDHLRLLYARVGQPHCPSCGRAISSQTVQQMTDRVLSEGEGSRVQILAPVVRGWKGEYADKLEGFRSQGFVRARIDGKLHDLSEEIRLPKQRKHDIDLVVDRIAVRASARGRIAESIETALRMAEGLVTLDVGPGREEWLLSETSACVECGISFPVIEPRLFSFNSPHGACPECGGIGTKEEFDPKLVVPDGSRPLASAIKPWGRRPAPYYASLLASLAEHFGAEPQTPWLELPARARRGILHGTGREEVQFHFQRGGRPESTRRRWDGVLGELERRRDSGDPESLSRYRTPRPCPGCSGSRLRLEARSIRVGELGVHELTGRTIAEVLSFIDGLALPRMEEQIAERILREIRQRLRFLCDVGLGYLTLDRSSASLSGGEGQRIRLATQMGSSLVGVLYILDEPSIGLHSRDHGRLLESLIRLRDLGNSVIVVEHDEATIRAADFVIDMGPGAGIHGGRIVAEGPPQAILDHPDSLTGAYLSGRRRIPVPRRRRPPAERALVLTGCREHNLKGVRLEVPLGLLVVVTGVSGSGKSSLVADTLHRALAARLHGAREPAGSFERLF